MRLSLVPQGAHTTCVACGAGAARSGGASQAYVFASSSGAPKREGHARPSCGRGRTAIGPGGGTGRVPPFLAQLMEAPQGHRRAPYLRHIRADPF